MRFLGIPTRFLVAILPVLLASCGGAPTSAVSGIVILDGKPVTSGAITFTGDKGIPITAEIQADGRYRAEEVPLGEVIVTLIVPPQYDQLAAQKAVKNSNGAVPPPPKASIMPEKYKTSATSDLKLTVKPGENPYDPPLKR